MPQYKLGPGYELVVQFIRMRLGEVDAGAHPGMLKALTLVPKEVGLTDAEAHEWVKRILDYSASAPEQEVWGLIEALEALLSIDERPAEQLIGERRA